MKAPLPSEWFTVGGEVVAHLPGGRQVLGRVVKLRANGRVRCQLGARWFVDLPSDRVTPAPAALRRDVTNVTR